MEGNLNVAANVDEIATPSTEVEEVTTPEVTTEPTEEVETQQQTQETDITQTQSFAKRLKEETAKAEQRALDNFIEQTYGASHGIHTYAEYEAAMEKQKQEEQLQELLSKNIPAEFATEMLESRKLRARLDAEEKAKEQQEKQKADLQEFINEYPNVKAEDIPVEVWQANEKGIPLRYAYADYAYKQTKKAEEIAKANAENAKSSTGTVTGNGVANDQTVITFEEFEKNKSNTAWVVKNYDKIQRSRANW